MERRTQAAPGHVIVQDNRTGKVSYWQKDYHQSASDSRGISTADYIHAMYFFLRQVKAKDVLMIGCGGGTLATMLHAHQAGTAISFRHVRGGTELPVVAEDPFYDFNLQAYLVLDELEVRPGDSFITTCVYDTSDRKGMFSVLLWPERDCLC